MGPKTEMGPEAEGDMVVRVAPQVQLEQVADEPAGRDSPRPGR